MSENTRATEFADDNPIYVKAKALAKSTRCELVVGIAALAVFAAIAVLSFFSLTTQDGYFILSRMFNFESAYLALLVSMRIDRGGFAFLAVMNTLIFVAAIAAIISIIVLSVRNKKLYRLSGMWFMLMYLLILVFICYCMNVDALPNACLVSALLLSAAMYATVYLFEFLRGENTSCALDAVFLIMLTASLFLTSYGSTLFMLYVFALAFGALKGKARIAAHAALVICAIIDLVMTALGEPSALFIAGTVVMILLNAVFAIMYFVPSLSPLLVLGTHGKTDILSPEDAVAALANAAEDIEHSASE